MFPLINKQSIMQCDLLMHCRDNCCICDNSYIWSYPRYAYDPPEVPREVEKEQKYSVLATSKNLLYTCLYILRAADLLHRVTCRNVSWNSARS